MEREFPPPYDRGGPYYGGYSTMPDYRRDEYDDDDDDDGGESYFEEAARVYGFDRPDYDPRDAYEGDYEGSYEGEYEISDYESDSILDSIIEENVSLDEQVTRMLMRYLVNSLIMLDRPSFVNFVPVSRHDPETLMRDYQQRRQDRLADIMFEEGRYMDFSIINIEGRPLERSPYGMRQREIEGTRMHTRKIVGDVSTVMERLIAVAKQYKIQYDRNTVESIQLAYALDYRFIMQSAVLYDYLNVTFSLDRQPTEAAQRANIQQAIIVVAQSWPLIYSKLNEYPAYSGLYRPPPSPSSPLIGTRLLHSGQQLVDMPDPGERKEAFKRWVINQKRKYQTDRNGWMRFYGVQSKAYARENQEMLQRIRFARTRRYQAQEKVYTKQFNATERKITALENLKHELMRLHKD